MRDFLPADKARREHVLSVIRRTFREHGFDEIETPVVEDSARLHAGLGGDNEKLAFAVMKRDLKQEALQQAADTGDSLELADLGLRFDLTVPLARFYATHRAELPKVFRAIQIAPVWRAERPQKGRFRQFVQCDIDIIGEAGPLAEIELIAATAAALEALGFTGTNGCTIRINDRRILRRIVSSLGIPDESFERALIAIDKEDKIGVDGVVKELVELELGEEATLAPVLGHLGRISGTNSGTNSGNNSGSERGGSDGDRAGGGDADGDGDRAGGGDADGDGDRAGDGDADDDGAGDRGGVRAGADLPADGWDLLDAPPDWLDPHAYRDLLAIRSAVNTATSGRARLVFSPNLVRGMGYYTGTIFEIAHPDLPYSLGGGGRYDGMIGRFLGTDVPAAGFSLGFERLVELVQLPEDAAANSVVLIYDADVEPARLAALKQELVAGGARATLAERPKNLKALIDQLGASGWTQFAFVTSATGGSDDLELRQISAAEPAQ
jgi:histidyl-tRNA synthetase